MKRATTLLIAWILGCGSPDATLVAPDAGTTDKRIGAADGPIPDSGPEICYPGLDAPVCLPLVPLAAIEGEGYVWPSADGSPNPDQYASPTHVLDLDDVDAETPLSPGFRLGELAQADRGRYGFFRPAALEHLESVRAWLGTPVWVNSGFRSPGYNAEIPGAATRSRHQYGDAVDLTTKGLTSLAELEDACLARGASYVKRYWAHVHCDWRNLPLEPALFE